MFISLFSRIWGLPPVTLKTGDTFEIDLKDGKTKELIAYDSSYSPFGFFVYDTNKFFLVHSCREVIASYVEKYFQSEKRRDPVLFAFKAYKMDVQKTLDFFNYLNSMLTEDKQIKVYLTNIKDTVVIDAPVFWFESFYRHAMLSLLIRLGCVYYQGDLDKAIDNYNLAGRVRPLIKLFLDGYYTEKSPSTVGIVAVYKDLSKESLEQLLIKNT